MPKRRYERREPTHEWQQIQPLLKELYDALISLPFSSKKCESHMSTRWLSRFAPFVMLTRFAPLQ
jgi:hypothetical protein